MLCVPTLNALLEYMAMPEEFSAVVPRAVVPS
jgi:hypothetical protein